MQKILLLALAGGLGSLSRFGLSGLAHRVLGQSFPYGTALVNVLGCFLFGLVWSALENRIGLSPQVRGIVLTGFMGAFTTFSTYIFETMTFIQHSQWLLAMVNLAGQNIIGLTFIFLGLSLGRVI